VTGWFAVYPSFVEYEVDAAARRMDAGSLFYFYLLFF
jgi:hypothetical protein